ncbi:MAG: hypothetical protein WBN68_21705 [Sedimenticolaceae bacterium]
MKTYARNVSIAALFLICIGWSAITAVSAETTTTTTTVTHPDGTTTQTVEETTGTAPASEEATSQPQSTGPNLIGPTGATGVIRRSDRRQDRREGNPRID